MLPGSLTIQITPRRSHLSSRSPLAGLIHDAEWKFPRHIGSPHSRNTQERRARRQRCSTLLPGRSAAPDSTIGLHDGLQRRSPSYGMGSNRDANADTVGARCLPSLPWLILALGPWQDQRVHICPTNRRQRPARKIMVASDSSSSLSSRVLAGCRFSLKPV